MVTRLYDRHGNRLALSCLHTVPLSTIDQVSNGGNGGGTTSRHLQVTAPDFGLKYLFPKKKKKV